MHSLLKKIIWPVFIYILCCLAACANPLNRATFNRYRQEGLSAEGRGDLGTAEISFYRAAENVRMGNLGKDLESDSLYNLGRVKRLVGKLDESEDLLKRSLDIDEERYGKNGFIISYTMGELALTFYEEKKYDEGVSILIRLEPIALLNKRKYSEQAKQAFRKTYIQYGEELSKQGRQKESEHFMNVSESF